MKIKEGFVYKNVAGNNLIVPIGKTAINFNAMININETGLEIWNCLKENMDKDQIVEKFVKNYDIDPQTAEKDIQTFIDQLLKNGIIEL